MDCVVLAGSGHAYKDVKGSTNKAFLEINGKPIIWYLVRELAQVPQFERIIFTGPKDMLETLIRDPEFQNYPKEIVIFEDRGDVLTNALYALEKTGRLDDPNRLVFVLPSDVPFVRKEEILQFLERCDTENYDFFSGIVSSEALSLFYPAGNLPGIQMAYFHTPSGDFRISNMHLARVANINNLHYLEKTYSMRYLKKVKNIAKMSWELVKLFLRIPGGIFFFCSVALSGGLMRSGHTKLAAFFKRYNALKKPERYISKILKTRFKIIQTDVGAMALDIDNDKDFETICLRFEEWDKKVNERVGRSQSTEK